MEVNGLDGEEIEEVELHIASLMETSAVRTAVTGSSKKSFTTTEPGVLGSELVAKARSEEVEFMVKIGISRSASS